MKVLVVGAGPIGLETAAVLQAEGHEVLVVDAGPIGATIARTFPPNTRFFTSPERLAIRGWPVPSVTQEKVTGEEYLAFLRSYVAGNDLQVRTFTEVTSVAGQRGDFRVNQEFTADVIVLATGGTDHPRRLGVPGEDLPHVQHYLGDPHRFFGRRVMVVGGRNSAAESALRLYRLGATVLLTHRGEQLHPRIKHWIRPDVESLIAEGEISAYFGRTVTAIEPGRVVTDQEVIDVEDVLLQIGYEQDRTLFAMAGIDTAGTANAPVLDPQTLESSVPGIYVVGTATAGTQDGFAVFIENSHQHADKVAAALAGRPAPAPVAPRPLPES